MAVLGSRKSMKRFELLELVGLRGHHKMFLLIVMRAVRWSEVPHFGLRNQEVVFLPSKSCLPHGWAVAVVVVFLPFLARTLTLSLPCLEATSSREKGVWYADPTATNKNRSR